MVQYKNHYAYVPGYKVLQIIYEWARTNSPKHPCSSANKPQLPLPSLNCSGSQLHTALISFLPSCQISPLPLLTGFCSLGFNSNTPSFWPPIVSFLQSLAHPLGSRQVVLQWTVVLWEDPAIYPNKSSLCPVAFSFPSCQIVHQKALRSPFIRAPTTGHRLSVEGQQRKHAWSILMFTCPSRSTR